MHGIRVKSTFLGSLKPTESRKNSGGGGATFRKTTNLTFGYIFFFFFTCCGLIYPFIIKSYTSFISL